jgi:sugar lactone lactonase YvrE
MVTALAEMADGGLLMVTSTGLFTLRGEAVIEFTVPDGVRTNDGKCDPWGRVWFGTMDLGFRRPSGELMRYDRGVLTSPVPNITLSNGLGWSPDGSTFYHVDSIPGVLFAYDNDPVSGGISGRRPLVDFSDRDETPDGLAVDADGNIWLAVWDGWAIHVYDPGGHELERVELPVQRPSCVVFGGERLDRLYVSTARENLDEDQLAGQPAAGELLVLDPGVAGMAGGVFGRT